MKAVFNVETYLHCSQDLRGTQHGLWPGLSPNLHLSDYGTGPRLRSEICCKVCLKGKSKPYQNLRAIACSLRGWSGAATNRSKPSDNVPIPARVASEPRGDGASASTRWRGPRLNSKVRIYECSQASSPLENLRCCAVLFAVGTER